MARKNTTNPTLQSIPVSKISPAKYNPRKDLKPGDPEYDKLKASIGEFGMLEPPVWNRRTGNLVGGHQRFKVAVEDGAKEIPCIVVDLDPRKEKTANLALNKISGEWDYDKLSRLLGDLELGPTEVGLSGFDAKEIEDILNWKPKNGDKEISVHDFKVEHECPKCHYRF